MDINEIGHKKYYTGECAEIIAEMITPIYKIDKQEYAKVVQSKIPPLELKDRVYVIADELRKRLPEDYPTAIKIIVDSLGPELSDEDGMFNEGWYLMPIARFVEEFGLEYPKNSMDALEEITKRHTAEYAVRPYVEQHYDIAMNIIKEWSKSNNAHVRRAASEGIRPRLPWATKLKIFVEDPMPVLTILESLKSDTCNYVRKSVGNNLNDIAKDHPKLVLETLERWKIESTTEATNQIIKRAARVLVKKGNQRALALIGATGGEDITISNLLIKPSKIIIGESFHLSMEAYNSAQEEHHVIMEYVIHLVRKNGKTVPKQFRLASFNLNSKQDKKINKKHTIKEVNVRAYYSGIHKIDITVNGIIKDSCSFELEI